MIAIWRYIVAWKLCTTMKAADVTATLDLALRASGLEKAKPADRPKLLSDNGSSYIAGDLANWLADRKIKHLRGAPYHPMIQGKIERWHQTLKNRILLENYFLPGDLEAQIAAFVDDYNDCRYHESIDNLGGLNSEQIPIRLRWCSGRGDLRSPRLANTAACA